MAKSDYGKKARAGYDKKFAEKWDKVKNSKPKKKGKENE